MRSSKKKLLNVTCSDGVRKKIDQFLGSQYQIWKQTRQPKKDTNGLLSCGNQCNNTLIMDYIKFIYNQYQIPDPLNPQTNQSIIDQTFKKQNLYSNQLDLIHTSKKNQIKIQDQDYQQNKQKPISKQSEIGQIYSPYKKFNISNVQKKLFDSRQTSQQNTTYDHHHDRTQNLSLQKSQADKYQLGSGGQDSLYNLRKSNQTAQQQILDKYTRGVFTPKSKKRLQFSKNVYSHSHYSKKNTFVPQIYRYCVACQQAVLDINIQRHQANCQQLTKVSQYGLDQLLNYLNKKIIGLRDKIKYRSNNLKDQDASSIKRLCQNMDKQCDGIFKSGDMSNKFINNYDKAIKIGKKWSQASQQINRLRWFIKIRQQLKKQFKV